MRCRPKDHVLKQTLKKHSPGRNEENHEVIIHSWSLTENRTGKFLEHKSGILFLLLFEVLIVFLTYNIYVTIGNRLSQKKSHVANENPFATVQYVSIGDHHRLRKKATFFQLFTNYNALLKALLFFHYQAFGSKHFFTVYLNIFP
jgi:hypothetical protein